MPPPGRGSNQRRKQRHMSMALKEVRAEGIEARIEDLLDGGDVDLAVIDAKMIALHQNRRAGQHKQPQQRIAYGGRPSFSQMTRHHVEGVKIRPTIGRWTLSSTIMTMDVKIAVSISEGSRYSFSGCCTALLSL